MKELFDAIWDKFVADGKYGLTQLYNTVADDEAVFPYVTMSLISDLPDWTFTEDSEDCLIQFSIFDDDPQCSDTLDAAKALTDAFDKFNLDVTGYSTVSLAREPANLTQVEKIWQYIVTYRLIIQSSEVVNKILTYGLPKTGQIIEYEVGDDGTYEAGWWRGRLNVDNRIRYIADTIDGDDVVLDLATGLMWAADGNAAGCNNGATITWANALIYAEALSFAGSSDWRLPNVKELMSIADYSLPSPSIKQPPFANTFSAEYWSSTTYITNTTKAWYLYFGGADIYYQTKTLFGRLRVCRQIT